MTDKKRPSTAEEVFTAEEEAESPALARQMERVGEEFAADANAEAPERL